MTESLQDYEKRLADEHKLLLTRIGELGFTEMDYNLDLWPPAHTGTFYLCTVVQGYTRNDRPKYQLVPLFRARVPAMHELFLRRKVADFMTNAGPKKYGK